MRAPTDMRQKIWMEPIQEMDEGEELLRRAVS
jgi:hypothetical protein